jgi:hypothetical protein
VSEANHATIHERFAGPAEALLARCAELAHADKKAEGVANALLATGIAAIVGLVVCFIAAAGTEMVLFVVGAGLLAVIAIGSFIARSVAKRGDLEDRKLAVAEGVVRALAPELKQGRPIEATIDFRAHHELAPKAQQGSSAARALAYEHPWLQLSFVLGDGTKVRLVGTLHAKRKTKSKRKYTKVKERCHETLSVELAPPSGRSFTATSVPAVPALGMTLARARVRPNAAELVFRTSAFQRTRLRGGWTTNGDPMLLPERVVGALVTSYKLLAAAEKSAT